MADLKTSDITGQNSQDSGLTSGNKNNFPKEITIGKFFSFPKGPGFTVKSIRINGQIVKQQISRVLRPKDRVEIVAEKDNFYEIFNKAGLVFEGGEYFPPQSAEDFKGNIISFTLPKEESEITVPEGPVWISLSGQNGNVPIQTKFIFLQTTNNTEDDAKKSQNAAEELSDLARRDSITAGLGTTRSGIRLKADEALATGNLEDLQKYAGVMASLGDTEGLKILLGKTSDQTFKVLLEQSIKISQNVTISKTGQKVGIGNSVLLNQKVTSQSSKASGNVDVNVSGDIAEETGAGEISTDTNVTGQVNVTGTLESSKVATEGQVEVNAAQEQILSTGVSKTSNVSISANEQSSGNIKVDEKLKTQAGISTKEQVVEAETTSPVSVNTQTELKQSVAGIQGKISEDVNVSKTGNTTANLNQNVQSSNQVSGNINVDIETQNNLKTQKQVNNIKENEDSKDIKQNRGIKADVEINQDGQIKDVKEIKDGKEVEDNKDNKDSKDNMDGKDDRDGKDLRQNTTDENSKAPDKKENQDSQAKLQTTSEAGVKALKDSLDRNDRAVEFRLGLNRSGNLGQKLKDSKPGNQATGLGRNNQKAKKSAGASSDSNLPGQNNLLGQGGTLDRSKDRDVEKKSKEKPIAGNLPIPSESENEQKSPTQSPKTQPGNEQQAGNNAKEKDQAEPEEELEEPEQQNVPVLQRQTKPTTIEQLEIEKAASLISHALNVLLMDAALWVWTASLISLGLFLIPAALAADSLPIIKKYLIAKFARILPLPASVDKNLEMVVKEIKFSGAVKLNIFLLNLAAIIWVCGAFVGVAYIGCNSPVGKEADYRLSYLGLAGYVDICKSLESAAGAFGVNAPTGLLITPQGLLSTASWTEAIKQTVAAYAPVDSCILRVVVEKESGGQADVIGCDCAYNGNPGACLNQPKKYYNGYQFNWEQCSYGIGITQWTIYQKRYATSATDFRRWRDINTPSRTPFGNAFYTVDDFLNPQTSLNLTAEKFQRDLRANGNDIRAAFGAYVGQSSSQSKFVEERMRLYEMCKANGG